MADVTMRRMLEAGVHFGHQTRFWNPKMAEFIFGERNKIHIINLEETVPRYKAAAEFVRKLVADGGTLLFVGSKRAAREAMATEARALRHAVRHAALARRHADELQDDPPIDQALEVARGAHRARRESPSSRRKRCSGSGARKKSSSARSAASRTWMRCRRAVFLIDVGHEEIAVREARKLGIPVVAVVDTNCSPEGIDYPIPGNDDAMRAIQLYAEGIADAVIDGKASIPEVPTGDDEFVELDESGKPKVEAKPQQRKAPPKKRAPRHEGAGERARASQRGGAAPRAAARKSPKQQRIVFTRIQSERGLGMDIKPALVKELRERTGAGMMECKKALVETNGDIDAAAEWLRKAGAAKADKKASRVAAEGRIAIRSDEKAGRHVVARGQLRDRLRRQGR